MGHTHYLTDGVARTTRYNYTGTVYFDTSKNRSFKSIVSTAKDIVNDALPIQCLEAVFVGAYLTAALPEVVGYIPPSLSFYLYHSLTVSND